MSFKDYIEDHAGFLIVCFLYLLLESFLLLFLGIPVFLIVVVGLIWIMLFGGYYLGSFYRKRKRMRMLAHLADQLDHKYLLHEIMPKHGSNEEQFTRFLLRIGNKSMLEQVSAVERNRKEYQEYIEQWVHEIKTPIAAMKLWAQNQEGKKKREAYTQLERIEHYVEQALFYARSENVEKDFHIQETDLKEVVHEALLQCKYLCTSNGIHVEVMEKSHYVQCDEKWIIFILNQLIENAVKYQREQVEHRLYIDVEETADACILHVADNGRGIPSSDIDRIFEKGFTGENGRTANRHATGIGLFLCKKLCDDLGMKIQVRSKVGEGCDILLMFPSYNSVRVS